MKPTLHLASGITLAMLLFCGCSDQPGASAEANTPEEDIAAIEKVFAAMKSAPYSLSVYPPDERPLVAYVQVAMARFISAFQTDETKKKESEQAFVDLIKKHKLTDTLEFTDNEDRMKAVAATSFANVDLDTFIVDVRAYIKTYGSISSDGDTDFEDEEEGTPVSMHGLKLAGDEAKATIINTDETEQPVVFVRSDDQWFVSWERTYGGEEDGSGITFGKSLIVTFENEAALENATAKQLLDGVDYDRSSRPTLERTGKPLQAELEFYVPGGEAKGADGLEAASDRHEAQMDAIRNSPGVKDVETSFGVEMREAFVSSSLAPLAAASAGNPADTVASLRVAALQVWFDQNVAYAETRQRVLDWAVRSPDAAAAERASKVAALRPINDVETQEAALTLARRAVARGKNDPALPWFQMALGMAEFRAGNHRAADESLQQAINGARSLDRNSRASIDGTSSFYLVMSLMHQGRGSEARQHFSRTAASMRPMPTDQQSPLNNQVSPNDVIVWLAYEEAQALLNE